RACAIDYRIGGCPRRGRLAAICTVKLRRQHPSGGSLHGNYCVRFPHGLRSLRLSWFLVSPLGSPTSPYATTTTASRSARDGRARRPKDRSMPAEPPSVLDRTPTRPRPRGARVWTRPRLGWRTNSQHHLER